MARHRGRDSKLGSRPSKISGRGCATHFTTTLRVVAPALGASRLLTDPNLLGNDVARRRHPQAELADGLTIETFKPGEEARLTKIHNGSFEAVGGSALIPWRKWLTE